jgi:diguanylate cyclase (GGDEF)-like protein/putative nucleotidyltransferase with HDIG domain
MISLTAAGTWQGTWLCPTDLDRARAVDASPRVRRIRLVGSAAVGLALVSASPWLGWWTLILFAGSVLNFATVDRLMAVSRRPEWVSVRAIVITLALLGAGVVLSGGPSSPALPWLVLPAAMVAARFRAQVVAAGLAVTVLVILGVTLAVDPTKCLNDPVPVISTLALLVGVVSIVLALQSAELHQMAEATVDPLTRLCNRRQLVKDLAVAAAQASEQEPVWLLMFDLDGFKAYNDTFGHLGGDLLLERLSGSFSRALGERGRAYRLGGDEFCALVWKNHGEQLIEDCMVALTTEGEGFRITGSYGLVRMPREASQAEHALQLADERMYAFKDSRRTSAGRQTRDLAMQVIAAYEPELREHARNVAELAEGVAARLGMSGQDLSDAVRAAELHDIGKVAIPYQILHKEGPLDAKEWQLMERHPTIGASILSSAPALSRVAEIVAASHERFDGRGYPRGMSGQEIPLASRVLFVCDSFDWMVRDTPCGQARPQQEALEELERCAGTQFDPRVVDAFLTEIRVRETMAMKDEPVTEPVLLTLTRRALGEAPGPHGSSDAIAS